MDRIVEGAVEIAASRDEVFELLTDYPRLNEWLPEVESARVLAHEGDVAIVEVTAPGLSAPKLVLELVHSPPGLAHFTRVDQYRGEGTSGTWELSEDDRKVELLVKLRPGPSFAGARGRKRLGKGLDAALQAIRHGVEEMSPEPEIDEDDPGRRKILEVRRKGDGVIVWHRGRTFELPRREKDG
jgi:hypothetical protein